MKYVITIDFGSTFTKVVVVDIINKRIILTDKVPSTVGTDAEICMNRCFDKARQVLEDEFDETPKFATSSAAGGLRMSVTGLTASLSSLAGKSAALGAGAKIIASYTGLLKDDDIRKLEDSNTEIILLSGGYEKGNSSMVLKNAEMLAQSDVNAPIVYAGNSGITRDIRTLMKSGGKKCYTVENIIPEIGKLNVGPSQEVIRHLFLERITDMKGFSRVKKYFDNDMIPTPVAVLHAGELLNKGTAAHKGIGNLMIMDIGGATTDVYSFNENKSFKGAKLIGIEETFAKRTVEGDLGMRENSHGVISQKGYDKAADELGISEETLRSSISNRIGNTDFLPETKEEHDIDDMIARTAIGAAARRHAGHIEASYERKGQFVQIGKNLTDITTIIGTGGILVHNDAPGAILKSALITDKDKNILLPHNADVFLDTDYVLFSAGLIRDIDEDAALEIMLNSIKPCLR